MLRSVFFTVLIFVYSQVLFANEVINIGIAWKGSSKMALRVVSGFEPKIKELIPNIKLHYNQNIRTDEAFKKVVHNYEKQMDAMILLRSTGAKLLGQITPTIPAFFGASNDPKMIGVLNNLEQPDKNITGVSYALDIQDQFKIFNQVFPDIQSILLITEKGHPSSEIDHIKTQQMASQHHIKYQHISIQSLYELVPFLSKVQEEDFTFVILGSQALIIDNIALIQNNLKDIPIVAYSQAPVTQGALVGLVPSDVHLGSMLAESVYDVLIQKIPINQIPVKFDRNPTLYFNINTGKRFGIELPSSIKATAILQ